MTFFVSQHAHPYATSVILRLALACSGLFGSTLLAEKAPLSAEKLIKESDLIVVGKIADLKISTERSHIDRGFGNYDWTFDVTINVARVEKGTLTPSNAIVVRCFRIKSRKSTWEYLTDSGNDTIPGPGTIVRAHLYKGDGLWRVIHPNGFGPVSPQTSLSDAVTVGQLRSFTYTFLLPMEVWIVVLFVALIVWALLLIIKGSSAHRDTENQ